MNCFLTSFKFSLNFFATLFILAFTATAAERYVAVDGTGDGSSADSPMASLADAYAQAAEGATKENPGVVHVASGMYRLSEAIEMRPYVKVVGDETGPTIFSGEYLFEGQHVYHWCKNQGAEESKLTKNPLWNNDLSFNEPNPSKIEAWFCAYTGRSPNNCTNAFVGVSLSACDNVFENLTFTLFKYGAFSVSASPGSRISFKKCRFYGDHVLATLTMDHYSIKMQNGSVILDDCEFVGCVGGVCCYGDPTEESIITNCVFRENSGTTALLFKDSAYGKVVDTRFSRNWTQTSHYGAAITDSRTYSETLKPIEISDCLFATNFVRGTSTVASQYGKLAIARCNFIGNRLSYASTQAYNSQSSAAALASGTGELTLRDSSFVGNEAGKTGFAALGILGQNKEKKVQIVNCTFARNKAVNEGSGYTAIIGRTNGEMVFVNSAIVENETQGEYAYLMYNYHSSTQTNPTWLFVNCIAVPEAGKPVIWYRDLTRTFTAYNSVLTGLDISAWERQPTVKDCAFDDPMADLKSFTMPDGRLMVRLSRNSPYRKFGLSRIYLDYDDSFWMWINDDWWSLMKSNKRKEPTAVVKDETSPIPDALGAERVYNKVALGPVNAQEPGLFISVR